MDEVFWANVVKRWSDASENVIILKKELVKVQEERDLFRSLVQARRNDSTYETQQPTIVHKEHTYASSVTDHDDFTIQDELQDAEAGLMRAKEEYRRLQQELAVSLETIKTLKAENENSAAMHLQDTAKLTAELARSNAQSKKDTFEPELFPNQKVKNALPDTKETSPATVALRERVQLLEQVVKDIEEDKRHLQDELVATKDKLHKAEESSKALLATIVRLQGIARHSGTTGLSHSVSNSLLNPDSRRPSKKTSYASTLHPQERDTSDHHDHSLNSFSRVDPGDTQVVSQSRPALPPLRRTMVAELPSGVIPPIDTSENLFDRTFLKTALANGMQSLIEHLPDNLRDKKSVVHSYLCPTSNHHPWCPTEIGQHGFIFVGLGKEKDAYISPVTRNLFVGLPKGHSHTRAFRYLGVYKVSRADPLSLDEWDTLTNDVKVMYSNLTKEKTHDTRSMDEILGDYDEGKLVAPCVKLQFLRFDADFYGSLISLHSAIPLPSN